MDVIVIVDDENFLFTQITERNKHPLLIRVCRKISKINDKKLTDNNTNLFFPVIFHVNNNQWITYYKRVSYLPRIHTRDADELRFFEFNVEGVLIVSFTTKTETELGPLAKSRGPNK